MVVREVDPSLAMLPRALAAAAQDSTMARSTHDRAVRPVAIESRICASVFVEEIARWGRVARSAGLQPL